jgi:fructoselysine 6-kinase
VSLRAVSVGDNCVDHYLPPISRDFVGGNAVNVAVHLQRAGCPAAYVGAIGADEDGRHLLTEIRGAGVDVARVKTYPGQRTACTHIRLDETNQREFVYEDLGPKDVFTLDEADLAFIQRHRLVHNTWQGGTENYLPRFKETAGLIVSQDYGERYTPDFIDQTIRYVEVAFFSLPEDADTDPRVLAQQMRARGPQLVVVTQGVRGSLAFDGTFHFQPAFPVEVVDTLGAGDTYIGTFLAHWLAGTGLAHSMERAAQAASQTCTHFGGW